MSFGKIRPRPKRIPGAMNPTEQKYADILEMRKRAGEILEYYYEGIKLKLADKTFYTPDFVVVTPDCVELHEVKGHWEDDARVKVKVAAERFWQFAFIAVIFKKGAPTKGRPDEWEREVF